MTTQPAFLEIDKFGWLAQMQAVLEVLNEGVIITNDHEVLFANSRFVEMTGIPTLAPGRVRFFSLLFFTGMGFFHDSE
jgi:PAS domain-containing protein